MCLVIEPDLITPEQYRDRAGPERPGAPEARLMIAVMADAVATYQRYARERGARGSRLFKEVESWLESPDASWPFSFQNICLTLRLEPAAIRCALEAWRRAQPETAARRYSSPFRRMNGRRHKIGETRTRERPPRPAAVCAS